MGRNTLNIGILGCLGRMGTSLSSLAREEGCRVVAGSSAHSNFASTPLEYGVYSKVEPVFEAAEVVLDFSQASALDSHVKAALAAGVPLLVGTTGHLTPVQDQDRVKKGAEHIPILYAPNTAVGVHHFARTVVAFCETLSEREKYQLSITEIHHVHKKDAPSGTALWLKELLEIALHRPGEIPITSVRKEEVRGEHQVHIVGTEETFTFSHAALSRTIFARGALRLAHWLVQQPPGLYTLRSLMFPQ